jgi:FkbM family methyltransferase
MERSRRPDAERDNYAISLWMLEERGFQVETVIDIGAAEGHHFLYRLQSRLFPTATHFFVDAMAENEEIYRKLGTKFGTGYEIAALSAMEGEVELRIDPDFYNTHIDNLQPKNEYRATRRVRTTTLDSVVARHNLRPPFALKLDVQGAELDVLRGALGTLDNSVVVTAEIQIFTQRDTIVELLAFMNGNGWALYDLTNLGYYPADGTLYQCYATFIPKSMDFRAELQWCLPEQKELVLANLRERRAGCLRTIEELLRRT